MTYVAAAVTPASSLLHTEYIVPINLSTLSNIIPVTQDDVTLSNAAININTIGYFVDNSKHISTSLNSSIDLLKFIIDTGAFPHLSLIFPSTVNLSKITIIWGIYAGIFYDKIDIYYPSHFSPTHPFISNIWMLPMIKIQQTLVRLSSHNMCSSSSRISFKHIYQRSCSPTLSK